MPIEKIPLEKICTLKTGKTPSTSVTDYFNGEIDWYCPADIGNSKYLEISQRKVSPKAITENKASLLPKGTLLVTCIGEIGRAGILQKGSACNQQITGLTFDSRVLPEYAYYWILANKTKLIQKANQAVVPILNNSNLKTIPFDLPPLHIQEQIADTLDKADALRRKDQQLLQKYDELAQAIFYDMFGDPLRNEKRWNSKKGKELFVFSSGKFNPTKNLNPDYPYPTYGGNGITGYSMQKLIGFPTIVIGRVGAYCGSIHVSEEESWITDNAIYIKKGIDQFNLDFAEALFRKLKINRFADYSGQPKITQKPLEELEYITPPIKLQHKYGLHISSIRTQKNLVLKSNTSSLFECILSASFE